MVDRNKTNNRPPSPESKSGPDSDSKVRQDLQEQLLQSLPENLREIARELLAKDAGQIYIQDQPLNIPREILTQDDEDRNKDSDKKDDDKDKPLKGPKPPEPSKEDKFQQKRKYVRDVVIPNMQGDIEELKAGIERLREMFQLNDPRKTSEAIDFDRQAFRAAVLRAEQELPKKVMGQQAAIDPVIGALKRACVGIRDPKRPIVSALAVGRTGVGKSLLAKELASSLSKGEDLKFGFLKVNCSEYSNGHEGARLTGAPPGYIGFDKPSPLKALVENPFHVILFDEVEKGSTKLHDLFLQILEDGELTLGTGETVSFKNCVILFSSNIGVEALDKALNPFGLPTGQSMEGLTAEQVANLTHDSLRRALRPELINRLDAVIPFRDIDRRTALSIAELEVNYAIQRAIAANAGCSISVNDAVYQKVWKQGYSEEYGAREIRRVVQKLVEEPLANAMFAVDPDELSQFKFDLQVQNGKIIVQTLPNDADDADLPRKAA